MPNVRTLSLATGYCNVRAAFVTALFFSHGKVVKSINTPPLPVWYKNTGFTWQAGKELEKNVSYSETIKWNLNSATWPSRYLD